MVRIVQCLCPARHSILVLGYEPGCAAAQKDVGSRDDITLTEANAAGFLQRTVEGLIERNTINPWCGICHSRIFRYEDNPTKFTSMNDARLELQKAEAEQILAMSVRENKN